MNVPWKFVIGQALSTVHRPMARKEPCQRTRADWRCSFVSSRRSDEPRPARLRQGARHPRLRNDVQRGRPQSARESAKFKRWVVVAPNWLGWKKKRPLIGYRQIDIQSGARRLERLNSLPWVANKKAAPHWPPPKRQPIRGTQAWTQTVPDWFSVELQPIRGRIRCTEPKSVAKVQWLDLERSGLWLVNSPSQRNVPMNFFIFCLPGGDVRPEFPWEKAAEFANSVTWD